MPHCRPLRATLTLELERVLNPWRDCSDQLERARVVRVCISEGWPEAAVTMPSDEQYTDLETLAAAIARSQILIAAPPARRRLPAGFDEVDVAILDWIAAEGRRASGSFARM